MILIISTYKESLHDLEFVKPIEVILSDNKMSFKSVHYSKLKKSDLSSAYKIIISGTSLQDNKFLKDLKKFEFIKAIKKPILGICAGMQIISLMFEAKLKTKTEIGFYKEQFKKEFLSLIGEHEVYHLHNNYTTIPKCFEPFIKGEIPQAIKHKSKEIYGVLFHPEVRNRKLIEKFCKKNLNMQY